MSLDKSDPRSWVTAKNVDLSNCDREQVQFSGAVQPHGALLVLAEPDLRILQASANSSTLLCTPQVEALLGQPVEKALGEGPARNLRDRLAREACALESGPLHLYRAKFGGGVFDTFVHRTEGGLIVEFESVTTQSPPLLDLFSDLQATVARLQEIKGLKAFFDYACVQVRRFTGYERVMAYKFLEDGSGHIVAESIIEGIEPYLDLRYPAADIPKPARRLFGLSWLRHLPNVNYEPVPLIPELNPATGGPLDQSRGLLRSVSPMYLAYRRNMGTQGAMVMPLLKEGALWGLISCMHHSSPLHVPYELRKACELLAHNLSLLMAAKEDAETAEYKQHIAATAEHLARAVASEPTLQRGLTMRDPNVLDCLDATGAAVATADGLTLLGKTPNEAQVQGLIQWLAARDDGNTVFATDGLGALYSPAADFKDTAAGLLAARLVPNRADYILWFRPEVERTVNWAGNPEKPMEVNEMDGEIRLSPRRSFALWKQLVQGKSAPWRDIEIGAAANLRLLVVQELILRQAKALEEVNRELSRSNIELDNFAYIASHDMKEPLRGITHMATFLERGQKDKLDEEGWLQVATIVKLTRRMDALIESLLSYSRAGRAELVLRECDLDSVLSEALIPLKQRLDETGTIIRRPRPLPKAIGEPVHLRDVFTNLISNAFKYNDKPERWVEIGWVEGRPRAFYVRDNGIGIAETDRERIFEIFRRLHARNEYGGGSGAGLTIARKTVERHGGRMWVESTLGEGSTFWFTLNGEEAPVKHSPDQRG